MILTRCDCLLILLVFFDGVRGCAMVGLFLEFNGTGGAVVFPMSRKAMLKCSSPSSVIWIQFASTFHMCCTSLKVGTSSSSKASFSCLRGALSKSSFLI